MDFEKFTERSRGFVQSAQGLALRSGHQRFTPEHLLKILLDDDEGLAANLIRSAGGLLYLVGMLIMCWNDYQTVRGRLREEKPMNDAAFDPAADRPLPRPVLAAAE